MLELLFGRFVRSLHPHPHAVIELILVVESKLVVVVHSLSLSREVIYVADCVQYRYLFLLALNMRRSISDLLLTSLDLDLS
jgi:hypothetical protein